MVPLSLPVSPTHFHCPSCQWKIYHFVHVYLKHRHDMLLHQHPGALALAPTWQRWYFWPFYKEKGRIRSAALHSVWLRERRVSSWWEGLSFLGRYGCRFWRCGSLLVSNCVDNSRRLQHYLTPEAESLRTVAVRTSGAVSFTP